MKILITTDLYATPTNGVVTSVNCLAEELRKKGHDVRILTFSGSRHSHRDGDVFYLASIPIGVYPNVRMPVTGKRHEWIGEILAWRPDVIHSQCEFFSFGFASYISKKTGAPIVHTYHTLYEQYVSYLIPFRRLGASLVGVLSRKRLRRVRAVIAPTGKVEQALRGYRVENPIRVIPTGISLEQHKKRLSPQERAAKRQALGISDDQTVLLNLGRLGNEKNLQELLRFYAKAAARQDAKLLFLIVGDGPAKAELEHLANALGISESVIFTGMVDPSQVQEYYQLGDVFVSASTSETQGLTYVEAAANRLPLLCRWDPCLLDVLKQGENGFAYRDEEEFHDFLHRLSRDPAQRAAAGKRSEEIASTFDKSLFGTAVERVYRDISGVDDPSVSLSAK